MSEHSSPKIVLFICTIAGLCLLGVRWFFSDDLVGFFLMLFLGCMALLRHRVPKLGWSSVVDVAVSLAIMPFGLVVALFFAMYHGMYLAIFAAVYVFLFVDFYIGLIVLLGGAVGLMLHFWEKEVAKRHSVRDTETNRYYQLEALQADLMQATAQVERMTIVSERTRIAREIHDNAGHQIVAAYMSLQTARDIFDGTDPAALELYDAALERLDAGVEKIRESVHNLAPIATLGVEVLQNICTRFPKNIDFNLFGDTRHVPVHVWNVLESCLNEGLTNVSKHANARAITVELDITPHIVRMRIENDGVISTKKGIGAGLRNLRQRLAATGGSLVVSHSDTFGLVCVIPIGKEQPT